MSFHLISASVISILFVAAGILAPPAMAEEYGITYEPETIYAGDTVTFQLALPACPPGVYFVRWEFGDGTWIFDRWLIHPAYPPPSAEYVYENVGIYTVKAICWNIRGELLFESSVTITVFPETIPVTIDIDPDTLNLASKGKWITCYIGLPEGHDVADIDPSTVLLDGTIQAELKPTEIGDYDEDGTADLMVKFSRAGVGASLSAGDEVKLTITGELLDGTPFEGSDTIRVTSMRR